MEFRPFPWKRDAPRRKLLEQAVVVLSALFHAHERVIGVYVAHDGLTRVDVEVVEGMNLVPLHQTLRQAASAALERWRKDRGA